MIPSMSDEWKSLLERYAVAYARSGISVVRWCDSLGINFLTAKRYITITRAKYLIANTNLLEDVGLDALIANNRREKIIASSQFIAAKYMDAAISRGSPLDDLMDVEAMLIVADINRLHDLITEQDKALLANGGDEDSLPLLSVTDTSGVEGDGKTTVRQVEGYSSQLVRSYEQLIKLVSFQHKVRVGGNLSANEVGEITKNVMHRLESGGVDALDAARLLGSCGISLPAALEVELKTGFAVGAYEGSDKDGSEVTPNMIAEKSREIQERIEAEKIAMAKRKAALDLDDGA